MKKKQIHNPFKQFLSSKAKFETDNGMQELETYVHHILEYLNIANKTDLNCRN